MTKKRANRSHRCRPAFTLVELLVVIGIIALLVGILLPALNNARQQAVQVKCLSQMKQLGNAFVLYVNDNKGWMPSSDTCGPLFPNNFADQTENAVLQNVTATNTWVGWVDGGPTAASLSNGTLWKYIKNAVVYKCPADANQYRNRTYSMNNYISTGNGGDLITNLFKVYRITQVTDSTNAIAFVEESDPRSSGVASNPNTMINQWNLNGWYEYPLICDTLTGISGMPTTANTWVDTIAGWHHGGTNVTFIDGHAEYWRFKDSRTVNMLKNDPSWPNPLYITPNDPDLVRFRARIAPWNVQRTEVNGAADIDTLSLTP